ncbi:MAG TPA: ATP-binding protein [Usitatibacter sp.]|nr:ATP-binding protein [Usitatibacter sp.]
MSQQLRIVHGTEERPAPARGSGFAANASLHALLGRAARAIVTLTGARGGAVRLVDESSGQMRLIASIGLPADWVARERSVAPDCGICGLALQENCLQVDPRAASCIGRAGAFIADTAAGPALALPLHCRGRAIGVFNLFFAAGAPAGEDLSRLLQPVSDMLDLAIENAFLEEERLRSSLVAERQMLASEVHDSLAQGLAFMRMRMTLLHDAVADGERVRALKYFDDVSAAMGEAHSRLRELITHFRSGIDQGLVRALESMARSFEERTGVRLTFDNRAADVRLAPEQEVQVYRIVQEALANVVKHAGAGRAVVRVERRGAKLVVDVEDDGHGVRRAAGGGEAGHYGLEIMRERAQHIGGELTIRSLPRKGTRVRLSMPAPPSSGT